MEFTHVDKSGRAQMVDVSAKIAVKRTALAEGKIYMAGATVEKITANQIQKGDVLSVARIAGIMGGKGTSSIIPLCHPINIDQITVDFEIAADHIIISSSALCVDKTGIEMEALTAVSVAALTIYDMCKAIDKKMRITDISLIEKTKTTVEIGK